MQSDGVLTNNESHKSNIIFFFVLENISRPKNILCSKEYLIHRLIFEFLVFCVAEAQI